MPSDIIDRDAILRAVRDPQFAAYVLDARRRLLSGRAATLREIRAIYREAGRLLAEDLRRLPRGAASWEIRERLREAIRARSRELSTRVAQAVTRGIHLGARVGVDPFARITAALTTGVVDGLRIEQAFLALAERQAAAQIARVGRDGLRLSDRIWRLDDITRRELERLIQAATLAGWDPRRLAQEVERFLQPGVGKPHRLELQRRLGVGRDVSYQAMRLARTELAIAQHEAAIAAAAATPGVELMDWLLSRSHAVADVCCRAGTLVPTIRGLVPIEQIRPQMRVLTHRGRWMPVVKTYRHTTPAGWLVGLRFQVGRSHTPLLVVTPNHPVLTERGWIAAGDLQRGDRGLVALAVLDGRADLPLHGVSCTASQGSVGSVPLWGSGTNGAPQYDAHGLALRRILRSDLQRALSSIGSPMSASDSGRCSWYRPSSEDCRDQAAIQTDEDALQPSAETSWDGASHNLDWLRPSWAHRAASSKCGACHRIRIPGHMSGTSFAQRHDRRGSRRWSRSGVWAGSLWPRRSSRTLRIASGLDGLCSSIAQHTSGCRIVASDSGLGGGFRSALWAVAFRTIRSISSSCLHYEVPAGKLQWGTLCEIVYIPTSGEEVFNLEVEEDHSYIANGIAVHNCDRLAAGSPYPVDRVPPRPHPQCLAPGTKVLTSRGWAAVEAVYPGDLVFTHRGRWRYVLAAWAEEADDLLEFELPGGGRLRVTRNHPLLTPDGWLMADELRGRPARYLRPEWGEEVLRGAALPEAAWEWGWLRVARRTGRPAHGLWTVYNLSVDEDESFIAEGVVVHNCMCYVVPRLPDREEAVDRLSRWVRNPTSDPGLERWWSNLRPLLGAGPRPVIRLSTPGGTTATVAPGPGARLADVARNLSPEETWRSLTAEVDALMRDAAAAEGVQYAVQGWTADGPTRGPVMDGAFGFTHLRPGGAPVTIASEVVEAVTRLLRDPGLPAAERSVALRGLRTLLHEASHQLRRYGNVTTADLGVLARWGAGFVAEEGATDLLAVLRLPDFAARLGVSLPGRPWAYASPAYRPFARFIAGLAGLAGRSRAAELVAWVHDWRTGPPRGWFETVALGILAATGVEGDEELVRELAARIERAAERIRVAQATEPGRADGLVAEVIRGLRQWVKARASRATRRRVGVGA